MAFNLQLDVAPQSRYQTPKLLPLVLHAASAILFIATLLLFVYWLDVEAMDTTIREVDQRLNLDLARKLSSRLQGELSLGNSEAVREELARMESEDPRIKAYLLGADGRVLSAADEEPTTLATVDTQPIERVLTKGESVLPRFGTDPARLDEGVIFSVARLDAGHYLYILLHRAPYYPGWRVDRTFRSLRELHTHLLLLAAAAVVILSARILWIVVRAHRLKRRGHSLESSPEEGAGGLMTTVTSITNTLQEKARLLAQHREERKFIVGKVSQEISIPLAAISTHMKEIGDDNLSREKKAELLQAVSLEVEQLISRIDTIFRLVKYDSLHASIEKDCIQAYECIQDAAQHFEPIADEKQIVIVYEVPLTAVLLWGDTELIHEAYSHLVREAISRASEGSELLLEAQISCDEVLLTVSFESSSSISYSFERPDTSSSEQERERLFGLYIARRIAEAHGGKVEVTTSKGRTELSLCLRRGGGKDHA